MYINNWCADVNKILNGKRVISQNERDPIKILTNNLH